MGNHIIGLFLGAGKFLFPAIIALGLVMLGAYLGHSL